MTDKVKLRNKLCNVYEIKDICDFNNTYIQRLEDLVIEMAKIIDSRHNGNYLDEL